MHRAWIRKASLAPLAALTLAGALASSPALAADPNQQSFPPPEEDNGVEKPMPRDDRFGHIYLAPSIGVVGGVGGFAPDVSTGSLLGLGYALGATLGIGISRYATVQILGDRMAFGPPANCNLGDCSSTSYSLGVGFTFHATQVLAFDPWASYGLAFRTTSLTQAQNATATVDGVYCPSGKLCPVTYRGIDAARIAFGGDFYPTPWFGFGPFVEVDIGTNLDTPQSNPPMLLPPNTSTAPRTYGFFQFGVRAAFDPMRARYRRDKSATARGVGARSAGAEF